MITVPLIVLAVLSLIGGFIELPHTMGHVELFSGFLKPVLPSVTMNESLVNTEWVVQIITMVISLSGVYIAYLCYLKNPEFAGQMKRSFPVLHHIWFIGWGFDALYNTLLVKPFVFFANVNKRDVVDKFYSLIASSADLMHRLFARTQGGILRWYAMGIVIGAIIIMTLGLLI